MIRDVFVFLHRWVGLLMTVFLVIVGLTGSLLAFNNELEHVFAPKLFASRVQARRRSISRRSPNARRLMPHAHVGDRVDGGARSGRRALPPETIPRPASPTISASPSSSSIP